MIGSDPDAHLPLAMHCSLVTHAAHHAANANSVDATLLERVYCFEGSPPGGTVALPVKRTRTVTISTPLQVGTVTTSWTPSTELLNEITAQSTPSHTVSPNETEASCADRREGKLRTVSVVVYPSTDVVRPSTVADAGAGSTVGCRKHSKNLIGKTEPSTVRTPIMEPGAAKEGVVTAIVVDEKLSVATDSRIVTWVPSNPPKDMLIRDASVTFRPAPIQVAVTVAPPSQRVSIGSRMTSDSRKLYRNVIETLPYLMDPSVWPARPILGANKVIRDTTPRLPVLVTFACTDPIITAHWVRLEQKSAGTFLTKMSMGVLPTSVTFSEGGRNDSTLGSVSALKKS
eukprot:1913778-Rhodomonas_salina.2